MREGLSNLKYVFAPKSIAVIGASENPSKLGNVILKNLVDGGYEGKIYPVNPKYQELLGMRCYPDIKKLRGKVDLAIFAIPAPLIPKVADDCGKNGVKGLIVLSAGFGEVGNNKLEEKLGATVQRHGMAMVGPNCLGVLNPEKRVDSIFFPFFKFGRPNVGDISIITQSGAVGTCIADLASYYRVGFSKFISYGNGTTINDADLVEYLGADPKTKQILLYLEGTKDGKGLLKALEKVNRKKPVIVLKAGKSKSAGEAAMSHTGNLAGNYLAYQAAFRESRAIEVDSVIELFQVANIFSQAMPKGKKVAVLTDGGGLGVLAADALEKEDLEVAKFSRETTRKLKKVLPSYVNAVNPLDIVADSGTETYEKALKILMEDREIDSVIVIILFQAPAVDSRIIDVLVKESDRKVKPIVVVAVGGEYTKNNMKVLDSYGIPTYGYPDAAVKSLKRFTDYSLFLKDKK
ncbi:CoA-binding protein [Candidatus Micrarchaeota archaeon]|nr:CoA-binding protein [Candidatus Micrarchaeota archaeon]MBD3417717.1 CoA-binding protein [Candidatus Micrarchaeota archaeon]